MTRSDKIAAQVAAGMQDCEVIREALEDSIKASFDEGDRSHILIDIAAAIEKASQPGISQDHWATVGTRLLHSLQCYARVALTAAAESDISLDDDEEDGE